MNKKDYSELHRLLALLKYELEVELLGIDNKDYRDEIRSHINAIDDIMRVFIVECE